MINLFFIISKLVLHPLTLKSPGIDLLLRVLPLGDNKVLLLFILLQTDIVLMQESNPLIVPIGILRKQELKRLP